jgi:hypothetical protein
MVAGNGSGLGWPGCGAPDGTIGGDYTPGGTAMTAGGGGGGGACGYIFVYADTKTITGITNPAVTP